MANQQDQSSISSDGKLKKKSPKKLVIGVVAGLVVIVGLISAFFLMNSNQGTTAETPKSLSKKFIDLFQASNSAAAYELFTDEWKKDIKLEYLNNNMIEPWSRVAKGTPVLTSNATATVGGKETEIYVYEIPDSSNSKKYYVKLGMVKVDNKWQISSLGILTDKVDAKS